MGLAAKILLYCPVSDEALLDSFVEDCIADGVSIIAVFGTGSNRIEDVIDEIVVGDGTRPDRFVCTTAHEDETLDHVINMLKCWEMDKDGDVQIIRL